MSGLVAGPGLAMYKVTGDTIHSGMHYLETVLSITSGCADGTTKPMIRGLEDINLGCGLSGEPTMSCGGDSQNAPTGVCGVNLHINPLACPGGITDVRYVEDICCSGAGIEVVYKHLRFSSCGLFTGTTGVGACKT